MSGKNKPKSDNFRQQNLKAWRPILTPQLVILLFLAVGCLFVPIGIAVIAASNSVIEVDSDDYSEQCCAANCDDPKKRIDLNPCNINIVIPATMEPPIYLYYRLSNYYQNHRRYVKSRSDQQLRGSDVATADLDTTCQNRVTTCQDDDTTCDKDNTNNTISPCGLIAWSMFNDSFSLLDSSGTNVPIDETGIAWKSDVNVKFKNAGGDKDVKSGSNFPPFFYERQQSCDSPEVPPQLKTTCEETGAGWCFPGSKKCVEDEHFIVWMRTAGLPTFRKLYAIIHNPLPAGTYTVHISNGYHYNTGNYDYYYNPSESADYYADPSSVLPKNQTRLYPVDTFAGTKAIVLSTSSWIGGKNGFLGGAYLTVGIICIVLAAGFAIKQNFFKR